MNKSMKPMKPIAALQRPLTEEEKKDQMMRAFIQKKASLAEGILFNLMQGLGFIPQAEDLENIVSCCNDIADEFMSVIYKVDIAEKEEEEEGE